MSSNIKPSLQSGYYRHYKGRYYQVIDCARHSETEEWLVVYRALYGDCGLWLRPLEMFTSNVEIAGKQMPRFQYVSDVKPENLPD